METYLAFSDAVERVTGGTFVRFDAVREIEAEKVLQLGKLYDDVLQRLSPRLFELVVLRGGVDFFPGLGGRRITTDRWYRLSVGGPGHPATVYDEPYDDEGVDDAIADVEFLDARTDPALSLNRLLSLSNVPDASDDEVRDALDVVVASETFVGVYDVGQGSASAVCSAQPIPHLYYDLGGGVTRNAATYPPGTRFCFANEPPVVLSHWDMDHWISGRKHPEALDMKWIVPRQRTGVMHAKFAADLHQRGNLLVWPAALPQVSFSMGRIVKLPAHRNRNYSGLVFLATVGGRRRCRVLCPGDAPYSRIPAGVIGSVVGVVAPHHGGEFRSDQPPPATGARRVVYSFGTNNSYHHPRQITLTRHQAAGWIVRRDTPNGNVAMPPLQHLPSPARCAGAHCTLGIRQ